MAAVSFDNSYARLPERLFARLDPTPVAAPRLIRLNEPLAAALGLDPAALAAPEGVEALAGNRVLEGAEPIAQVYAGHQFGHWNPQLGDGRAILLGEVVGRDGRRDIQLKGSGPTPFSRMGDGRAPLGPVLREYVVSEAMAALSVPTTRALAAVATGEPVYREAALPGGVLTRVAASHIRVGTFQFFASKRDEDAVRALVDHALARHYPDAEGPTPAAALLAAVIDAQARLVARWMALGFIHGVMNTDNMAISGETIDFGPCAFMDAFSPDKVFSSIDQFGRYAYSMQPKIAHWNLAQLGLALVPLLGSDEEAAVGTAKAALDAYPAAFEAAWLGEIRRKLGLLEPREGDKALAEDLFARMAGASADFTLAFRGLADLAADEPRRFEAALGPAAAEWLAAWRARLAEEGAAPADRAEAMRRANPILIPRNHLVEAAIEAGYRGDDAPFHALVDALADPFVEKDETAGFAAPPAPEEEVTQTFCGT
ncbi:MAG: YdiU family protein [Pseudomonadota bacterium]